MNWDAIGAISEVVGAAAVVISLIYVAIQIRQNTISQNAQMHQQLLESQTGANRGIVDNEGIAELVVKANSDFETLTPSELLKLNFVYLNFFNLWHSAYANHERGMLDSSIWEQWDRGYRWAFTTQEATVSIWNGLSSVYDPRFRAHVEASMKSISEENAT